MKPKTIPLSLHTRRVVAVLAINIGGSPEISVDRALTLLGYPEGTPDIHGLRDQVLSDVRPVLSREG